MEEKIDQLQEKCFAMLGTINKVKTGEINLEDDKGVHTFSTDAKSLLESTAIFFGGPPKTNDWSTESTKWSA